MEKLKTYADLVRLKSFEERYEYLKISNSIGARTFGFDRWMNQEFYRSYDWRKVREEVLLRDDGFDLGCITHPIAGPIFVHHMNPVKPEHLKNIDYRDLLNPEFLISTSFYTHQMIHYGVSESILPKSPIRKPGDTKLW